MIIIDWSLERPPSLEVMYWLTPAMMQHAPLLRVRTVSSAVPVLRLRRIDDDRRLCKASSNILAVLSFNSIELLRDIYIHAQTS